MFTIIRTGLDAIQRHIDTVTHNIANLDSTAFKRSESQFEDIYAHTLSGHDMASGHGAQFIGNRRSHAQGALLQTDQALDVAIEGSGFFVLGGAEGQESPLFTRDGSFSFSADGRVLASDGRPVLDQYLLPVVVPMRDAEGRMLSDFEIDQDGTILLRYGRDREVELTRLATAVFNNPGKLRELGNGRFAATVDADLQGVGPAGRPGAGFIRSGFLEAGNAEITRELSSLIRAQQAFGANAKLMQTESDITRSLID